MQCRAYPGICSKGHERVCTWNNAAVWEGQALRGNPEGYQEFEAMNTALILSGGVGSRLGGDMPKQYIEVGGRSASVVLSGAAVAASVGGRSPGIVAQEEWQGTIRSCLKRYDINKKFRGFSNPGENRQLSIYYNGLRDILTYAAGTDDTVLVHDGARPCLPGALITECVNALERHDGVIPVPSDEGYRLCKQ